MISLEKGLILTPSQKLPKNLEDLDKLIVAKGFKRLPNVQKIARSGHTAWKLPPPFKPILGMELRRSSIWRCYIWSYVDEDEQRVGPIVKQIWNGSIHSIYYFLSVGFVNTKAFGFDQSFYSSPSTSKDVVRLLFNHPSISVHKGAFYQYTSSCQEM